MPKAKRNNKNSYEALENDPGQGSPEPSPPPDPKTKVDPYPRPKGKESMLIAPPPGIAPNSIKLYLRPSSKTTKDKKNISLPGSYADIASGSSGTAISSKATPLARVEKRPNEDDSEGMIVESPQKKANTTTVPATDVQMSDVNARASSTAYVTTSTSQSQNI